MNREIKVGSIVLLALLSLFISIFFIQGIQFQESGKIYIVRFRFLANLRIGSTVRLYGSISVGSIQNISYGEDKAQLHVLITAENVNKRLEKESAAFSIRTSGLIGEPYLLLELNTKEGKKLERMQLSNGTSSIPIIDGLESPDYNDLIITAQGIAKKIDSILGDQIPSILNQIDFFLGGEEWKEILENLSSASKNFDALGKNANELVVNIRKQKLDSTVESLQKLLTTTESEIQTVSKNLQELIQKTDQGVMNLLEGEEGIPSLFEEGKKTLLQVNSFIDSLDQIIEETEQKNSPIGALVRDSEITEDLKKTIRNLSEITEKLKDHPLIGNKKQKGPF